MSLTHARFKTEEKDYTEDDYYSIPENIRAELIKGKIYYLASPSRIHQEVLSFLHATIYAYIKEKKGNCKVYPAPFAVKLFNDRKTIVEPDISVICDPDKLTDKGCSGAPDWIIEIISPGNPGNDYVHKLNLYADAGVREYWIADPNGKTVSVYNLESGTFRAVEYSFEDEIKVMIYEDLSITLREFAENSQR